MHVHVPRVLLILVVDFVVEFGFGALQKRSITPTTYIGIHIDYVFDEGINTTNCGNQKIFGETPLSLNMSLPFNHSTVERASSQITNGRQQKQMSNNNNIVSGAFSFSFFYLARYHF